MDTEFYNAFATPTSITQSALIDNETGTSQRPPKLMDIDDYNVWSERFGNWVEAYHLDAWEHTEEPYVKPTKNDVVNGTPLTLREMSTADKKKYRDEKLMVSLLQQAIKEDILILLQHDGTAYSMWTELEAKFTGSDDMLKNKMSLMKKEFDLFRGLKNENTKQIIDRYCNLVRNMTKLGVKKDTDELIEKLADALPYETWGTFLMMLRSNKAEYKKMTLGDFIKHLEAQEMEQRKIARMKNYDGEHDISLYYKHGVTDSTKFSPKIETAYSVKDSPEKKASQGSSNSTRFSSFDPNISVTKNGRKLQCNIVLSLENDQDYTEEIAKNQMSLLGMTLEYYSCFVAGKIGNPMLTKEDYDQIDAEEMELMDIKWCMASVMRRVEKEKGHFKRECKNREATGAQNPFGNNDYHKEAIYHQITPPAQQQTQTVHGRDVVDKRACVVSQGKYDDFTWEKYLPKDSKVCLAEQDDEKLAEGFTWDDFCPDQNLMAKEIKVMGVAEEKRRRNREEAEEEERLKEEAKAEKRRRAEFLQPSRNVKEVPEYEVKIDAEQIEVSEKCLNCDSLIKQNNELLHNIHKLKESYDTMNREINKYTDSDGEQAEAMNTLKIAYLRQLDTANFNIKKCADLELELATQKIETEKVKKLLDSYSCSTFVVDRIYPVVKDLKTFKEEEISDEEKCVTNVEEKLKASGKKPSVSYNRCPPPVENGYSPRNPNSERVNKAINLKWESGSSDNLSESIDVTYTSSDTDHESKLIKSMVDQVLDTDDNEESKPKSKPESKSGSSASKPTNKKDKRVYDKEFLLSKSNLNDESVQVAYTLKGSDKLYSDESFPIRSVRLEMIQKVFKITEINISEIKDLNFNGKPKQYTSRDQQRINKKMGYNCGYSFQKKPNHNRNYKKKGLGFVPQKNYKNEKVYKPKTMFVAGKTTEVEKEKSFRNQTNQEFLAKKQEDMKKKEDLKKVEKRSCFQCKAVGHVAKDCPKTFRPKQEFSRKMKEKIVEKTELSTRKFTGFENSTYEKGESSKSASKRIDNATNQKWVVKGSGKKSGDDSDSIKSEEPHVEKEIVRKIPKVDDVNFPPLNAKNYKSKIGKVEISNQFYSDKKKIDVEKTFNGNVKRIFGKMVSGKAQSIKDFYASKGWVYKSVERNDENDEVTPKEGQAWVDIFFQE
ncbi:putative transcription factor interactor and regulator CCHC(Zn) family [Helianthus annuus]|nr:putative transcription factor interactor and regulator CCHC(Zn) family [Helianthus annuus]